MQRALDVADVLAAGQAIWLGSLLLALCVGAWQRLIHGDASVLCLALAIHVLLFAAAGLWLQWRIPRPLRWPLRWSWVAGLTALVLAASSLLSGTHAGLLTGVLGLGIALPLLLNGMLLEIVAFVSWIGLHRQTGRGTQLPSVQRLLTAHDKTRVLLALLPLALLLPAAVWWPMPWLARLAGLAMLLAWLGVWLACVDAGWRANRFLLMLESRA